MENKKETPENDEKTKLTKLKRNIKKMKNKIEEYKMRMQNMALLMEESSSEPESETEENLSKVLSLLYPENGAMKLLIKNQLQTLLFQKIPFISNLEDEIKNMTNGYRRENNYKMFIKSVSIVLTIDSASKEKYGIEDAAISPNSEIFQYHQVFMISKKTTIKDLKIEACKFWNLENSNFELFENNHILLIRYDEPVELYFYSTIETQRAKTEFILKVPDRDNYRSNIEIENDKVDLKKKNPNSEFDPLISEKERKKKERKERENLLIKQYRGLQYYTYDGKKYQVDDFKVDNHVVSFFFLLALLLLNIFTLFSKRQVENLYFINQSISNIMENSNSSIAKL